MKTFPTLAAMLLAAALAAGQSAPPNPSPLPAPEASVTPTINRILDRMSANEKQLYARLQELSPRVETYMQNLRTDPVLGDVPTGDRYQLGILAFDHHFQTTSFLAQPPARWRQWIGPLDDLITWPARKVIGLNLYRSSFASMLFPGADHFDRQHYRFVYVRREFLGQIRCYVFDVAPLDVNAKGSFWGRIWIEDQNDILVRFNGSFWQNRYGHPDLHFDSWRINVDASLWLPAYIYTEESDLHYGLFRHAHFAAQTRLWGYDLHLPTRQQALTAMSIEGAGLPPTSPPQDILSPIVSLRDWERQAENNVLDRLQDAGLLAPPGPADAVLQTVVNNLIITNHLAISPAVRCRILLTTPLESLAVGHTIVVSRGLIDSLPDEAALAAMLAHELAQIDLGQRLDTRYAFADRMLFADQDAYRLLDLKRTPTEEAADNALAVKLLSDSPYKSQLAAAGLFLRQVAAREKQTPQLFNPHLGNGWFSHDYLTRLQSLETAAPPLAPASLQQTAALPLGGRLLVNPWDGSLSLETPESLPLLSAREKLPLQVTPFFPYLERAQPATTAGAAAVSPPADTAPAAASPPATSSPAAAQPVAAGR